MAGSVTLADVARAAAVSPATASRVLNGSVGRTVRADLAARVMAVAAELGYSVNAQAQAMARGSTTTVGLIVHDISDPYAAAIASGVMAAAAERDLIVTIASTLFDPQSELDHLRALVAQRARAVILAGSRFVDSPETATARGLLAAMRAHGGRSAAIGQDQLGINTIHIDHLGAANALAGTLYALGYRRFAVLAGPEHLLASEERLAGFRMGLEQCGIELPMENIIGAQYTRDGGYVAMAELLDRDLEVDAVFAVNDVMAVGAMAALREQGHRVPADIAVAGFDDIAMLSDISPSLTTVRLPLIEMGRAALELALDTAPGDPPQLRTIAGEVVVRTSTPEVIPVTAG